MTTVETPDNFEKELREALRMGEKDIVRIPHFTVTVKMPLTGKMQSFQGISIHYYKNSGWLAMFREPVDGCLGAILPTRELLRDWIKHREGNFKYLG